MATNTLAPMGLVFNRNRVSASPTYQINGYTLLKSYATKIGVGDMVMSGTSTTQGYVILAPDNASTILGVFAGVQPYYDLNLQTTVFTQWWTGTQNASADVGCYVGDDPNTTFRAQVNGGTYATSWRGQNIGWTAGTNGAPNISGISVLSLSFSSLGLSGTLPFKILGPAGMSGGPQDPGNVNPWVEVSLNTSEYLNSTGV